MRFQLNLLLATVLFLSLFSCKDNPSSPKQKEIIRGIIINNYSDPGPLFNAQVNIITGKDTLSSKTNNRGYFEIEQENILDADSITISVTKNLYKEIEFTYRVPQDARKNGILELTHLPIPLSLAENAMYIAGTIDRSVEDDSVVVNLIPSIGCYPYSEKQRQNIGESSAFSIAVNQDCEELHIYIDSKKHKKTNWFSISPADREILDNPKRIENLKYKIYSKDQTATPVTVRIKFYTEINGEKVPTVLNRADNFNITLPTGAGYYDDFLLDEHGVAELHTVIESGADTLSLVMWNNNSMHYFERKNFPLLDYEIDSNNIIDLGEHEVAFGGVYVWGNAQTDYYDYKGDFSLTIEDSPFRFDKGNFIFPAPKTSNAYTIKLDAQYYENIDTVIQKSDLSVNGQKVTGLNLDLKPTLYQIALNVDLIGLNGNQHSPVAVPLRIRSQQYMTNNSGVFNKEINNEGKYYTYTYGVNEVNTNNHLPDYTSATGSLDLNSHSDYKVSKNIPIYEIGSKIDYSPEIRVGTKWVFDYKEVIAYGTANDEMDKGSLTWEIVERLSDSTFILQTTFDGTNSYYSAGETYESESDITGGKYILTINNMKWTFEVLDEGSTKRTKFINNLGNEINFHQPSTYVGEYTKTEIIESDLDLTTTTIKTGYTEEKGLSSYFYELLDYDSITISADLESYSY